MLKKIFISAILLIAVLCFVVSLLKGNNREKTVTVPDRVAVINIEGMIVSSSDAGQNIFSRNEVISSGWLMLNLLFLDFLAAALREQK